jgi:hypothetical protein
MYTIEEKAQAWATALLTASGAALLIATTVLVAKYSVGAELINKAQALNLTADAHRAASLAKTYDAKAAATAMKALADGLK